MCSVAVVPAVHTPYPTTQTRAGLARGSPWAAWDLRLRSGTHLTYKDLFSLVRRDPDPELMLLFIICSRKSCIFDSKRLYSVRKTRERAGKE